MLELLVVMAISTILITTAVSNLKELVNPSQNAAAEIASTIKQARAKAIASTSSYRVQGESATSLKALTGTSCAQDPNDMVEDTKLSLDLASGASFVDPNWFVCFSSRGLPDANVTIQVRDNYSTTKEVEVMLGGAVRVYDY